MRTAERRSTGVVAATVAWGGQEGLQRTRGVMGRDVEAVADTGVVQWSLAELMSALRCMEDGKL
jgi:hypothetical protein